jgi:hypothetical protein
MLLQIISNFRKIIYVIPSFPRRRESKRKTNNVKNTISFSLSLQADEIGVAMQ